MSHSHLCFIPIPFIINDNRKWNTLWKLGKNSDLLKWQYLRQKHCFPFILKPHLIKLHFPVKCFAFITLELWWKIALCQWFFSPWKSFEVPVVGRTCDQVDVDEQQSHHNCVFSSCTDFFSELKGQISAISTKGRNGSSEKWVWALDL